LDVTVVTRGKNTGHQCVLTFTSH